MDLYEIDSFVQNGKNNKHTNINENINNELSIWIRNKWVVGSMVEVYSYSFRCWFEGNIRQIFTDYGGECLEIEYMENDVMKLKHASRNDMESIRPSSNAITIYKYIFNAISQSKCNIIKNDSNNIHSNKK
eukprot:491117_1